jgi:hypothetical protein
MAAIPYIPTRDSALDSWADNFQTLIAASPATYGLDPADATAITNAFNTWHAAYLLGGSTGTPPVPVNPSTFTRVTVAAKNAEKIAMVVIVRSYASQIRINPGVSNSDKTALGLNLPNNSPSPIGAPTTFPLLALVSAGPGTHEVRYADSTTPAARKKPTGVIGLQLFRGVGVAPIADPAGCAYLDTLTVQPYQSVFDPGDVGKVATYFGRWVTRGRQAGGAASLVGPWSSAVTMTVAF